MMKLRPYQREAVDCVREVWDRGVKNALVVLPTGAGKALRDDQRVLTPAGWKQISEMKVGDEVVHPDGGTASVTGVYPQGERELVKLTMTDGAEVVCDLDHLWTVRRMKGGVPVGPWETVPFVQILWTGRFEFDEWWLPAAEGHDAKAMHSWERVEPARATCIKIDREDGLFITEGYTVTHNTICFAQLVREVLSEHDQSAKALIIAHRNELIQQARDKYLKVDNEELVGIYQGKHRETWARVICASIQSCYGDKRDKDGRIVRKGRVHELPLASIKLIVIDEAHHAPAQTYLDLLATLREAYPDALLFGVTATPYRTDGSELGVLWDSTLDALQTGRAGPQDVEGCIAYRMGIDKLIDMGFLAPISRASKKIVVKADLAEVKISRATKDFQEGSLAAVMNTQDVRETVVERWIAHAGPGTPGAGPRGRPTVVFCAGVDAARDMAQAFNDAGIKAGFLAGSTKKAERSATIDAFQRRELDVLCNCAVLTEGWDAPHTSCVVMARPTKSLSVFVQAIGRGMRIDGLSYEESCNNGKSDCLLLDFCGASDLGVMGEADLARSDIVPGIDASEDELEEIALLEADPFDLEDLFLEDDTVQRAIIHGVSEYAVDLFGARVAWSQVENTKIACVTMGLAVVLFPDRNGGHTALAVRDKQFRKLAEGEDEHEAMRLASAFAMMHGDKDFLRPGPWWTNRPASENQIGLLKYRLQANQKMDAELARQGVDRAPVRPDFDISRPRSISMAHANVWLYYLGIRLVFGKRIAEPVDELFKPEERVEKVKKLRMKKARAKRQQRAG